MFGSNTDGQLGLGHNNNIYIPTLVPDFDNIVQIACGVSPYCIFNQSRRYLYFWS